MFRSSELKLGPYETPTNNFHQLPKGLIILKFDELLSRPHASILSIFVHG